MTFEPWITEPDVYELDESSYHADPVVGGSLSSSGARTILDYSPKTYREADRVEKWEYDFGHAAHAELLGVGARIVVIEADDWRLKKTQQERDDIRASGGVPLLRKDMDEVKAMGEAVRAHPVVGPLFTRPGRAEVSAVARDPETGVMCRMRADWLPDVADDARLLVVDYKSSKDARPKSFERAMWEYGYDRQGPWYCDVLTWLGLDHGVEPQFILVAQERTKPYLISYGWPSARAVEWGRVRNRKARGIFRDCMASGQWPGYSEEPQEWDIPDWLDRKYAYEMETGAYRLSGDLS